MAKGQYTEWDSTANNNTDVAGISLAENVMQPPAVNDAFRAMMAQLKTAGFVGTPTAVQLTDPNADRLMFWDDSANAVTWLSTNAALEFNGTTLRALDCIGISVVSETTTLTIGTAKRTFRMPWAFTVTAVRGSLSTASSSGLPTFDINNSTGNSILSTKLTIDANELTSTTAATAPVISVSSLSDDELMSIDIDVAGTGAKGAKVYLYGYRP